MADTKHKFGGTNVLEEAASGAVVFLKTLRKQWPIVVAAIAVAVAAAALFTKLQKPLYEASALLEFDPNVVRPISEKNESMRGFTTYWDNQEYYETQYKILTSDKVLTRVARDLGLAAEDTRAGGLPLPPEEYAARLRGALKIEPMKNSRLVRVNMRDGDPKRARRVCDAIVATYLAQNIEKTVIATSDAVVWLNGQVDHYKTEVETNENALHEFKRKNDLPSTSLNESSNMVRREMETYNDALSRTRTKKQELLARHSMLSKASPDTVDDLPASELLASSFLQKLRGDYLSAIREREKQLNDGKGENHPLAKKAEGDITKAKRDLLQEVRNIQGAVERDLAVVTRQEAGESSLFENARKRAVELNMKEIEYHRLDRARDQNEKIYAMLLERMKQADLARMMNVNNVRLVDAAIEPKIPVKPILSVNLAVGLTAGILIGIALVWLRVQLDSSIKTPDEVESKLGVTFLGLIPAIDNDEEAREGKKQGKNGKKQRRIAPNPEAMELIVHERPLSGVAEASRSIRTNILFMNPDQPYRRILVSSAAPSEGKTTVACSIAIALAQGGQRVCIVDCDLRRPRMHRIFNRAGDAGVTNVLVGEATIEEVAKPTVVQNLWSIPAGPTPPNPADMLQSERFKQFLRELGERFDRVIIDSPPLVAVTDAAVLSTLVDGTIFVMRAFKTSRQLAQQGLRALRDVDSPIVGAVLNAVNLNHREYTYYHYYYYKREGYRPLAPPPDSDDAQPSVPN